MEPRGKGVKGRGPSAYLRPRVAGEAWNGKIERLSWGGLGLAHAEDGRLILLRAPLALFPGEEVQAEIHWKPRHGEGKVKAWTLRDPRRTDATCPVAAQCGGCDLWEAGTAAPDLKRLMVADLFHRALPDAPEWSWHPAPAEARRHRIQLHWDGKGLGFHRRGSHQIVVVEGCPAAADPLSAAIPRFREALQAKMLPTRAQRWELSANTPATKIFATDEGGRSWVLEPDGFQRTDESAEQALDGIRLRHRAGGFFQACPAWAWEAFKSLLTGWDLRGSVLFDLYGGVGLFSAMLKDRFQRFVVVESDEAAAGFAKKNLSALKIDFEAHAVDVEAWVAQRLGPRDEGFGESTPGLGKAGDTLLLDPPREGLSPELCLSLQTATASTLVLVGCDGAAFCRDAKRLGPAWKLSRLAALDLFPLTNHVECVGLFEKAVGSGR